MWGGQFTTQAVENTEVDTNLKNQLFHGFQQQYNVEMETMRQNFHAEHEHIINERSRSY